MGDTAIRIEGLSKRYRIGEAMYRYGRLTESLWRGLTRPFRGSNAGRTEDPLIWALKDVDLEVPEGTTLGIIGLNGAGKSTLLKVVSRITPPTEGTVQLRGRVGSLLEVGTGFHPELTGRENVYLNGAILGMRKTEIDRKFDEMVAFSGIERFIDTPVKRYSTGMYVRLAFAVAAHLDTEILLVDEVLAVGDVDFQRRCFGKIHDVASGGRTVLLVSHQLTAITRLCDRAILLERGSVREAGPADAVVAAYLRPDAISSGVRQWEGAERPGSGPIRLERVALVSAGGPATAVDILRPIEIELTYELLEEASVLRVGFLLNAADGTTLFMAKDEPGTGDEAPRPPGRYTSVCRIPGHLLNEGSYAISPRADQPNVELLHVPSALTFDVVRTGGASVRDPVRWPGVILPELEWIITPEPVRTR